MVSIQGMNFPQKIEIDQAGNLWILQSNNTGFTQLRVFKSDTGLNRVLSMSNNQGGLPNGVLQDIELDRENRLWVALSSGIAFIPNASTVNNSSSINAIQPLFENAPLLNGESITAIANAPDLSVWLGTEKNGLWNFTDQGTTLLHHFTRENSPIYSNEIVNLTFDDRSGELFIVLPEGGISYRTGTSAAFETLEALKIYPNPVRPDFNGLLSIEGLSDFAEVKITSSAGRVIYSIQVRGGKLAWNLRDNSGNRPVSGVYLVYVLDEFGRERIAGKFVII
jgi:ligand-binding sensor domain-containing protein